MDFNRKIFIIGVTLALALGFGAGLGYSKQQTPDGPSILVNLDKGKPKEVDFSLFWDVWQSLNENYVNKADLDVATLVNGAIEGMVEAVGDPYTVYFEPETSKKFQESISGSFSGVGMEIGKRNEILTVISPIKDSPAFKAGIQAGDQILGIDSKSTADLSVEEAVNLIRGKKGTNVTLTISRGEGESRDVELTRDTIRVPTVTWELMDNNVAYVQLFEFNQTVDAQFKNAAEEILKSGADRIVLDLRNNPGGLLDSAINIAGWFLDRGQVVVIEDFGNGIRNEFKADGNGSLKNYPLVILINGGSASASEILAGAVKDHRNIQLVGEKSFGKGSVQEISSFSDGSSLKVTVAKWLTPNGASISDTGISPTIEVKLTPEQLEGDNFELGTRGKDPQLDRAIDEIK